MFDKRHFIAMLLTCAWAMSWGCAVDDVRLGNAPDDAGVAPANVFVPPPGADGGDAGDAARAVAVLACIGTECPAPYATCSNGPSFKCQTNLLTDSSNCGACGTSCGNYDDTNMASRCVHGACAFECMIKDNGGNAHQFANCNGLLDDGCEIDVSTDHDNCGACGHACGANVDCINSMCGCPSGKTDCDGTCVDVKFDSSNCGACGNACPFKPPGACTVKPPHTTYGCGDGHCGTLTCQGTFRDCDKDLGLGCASDGCEADTAADKNNCGGCGVKCGPDEQCRNDGSGPQCVAACETSGLTQCLFGCKDLQSDASNCGSCGNFCPLPRDNQQAGCADGLCRLECLAGFADCNGDPSDGCEIDVRSHPANCGVCGNKCDFGAGQPCIEGTCLMVECAPGGPTK
jgi:hypothetical protein